MLTTDIILHTNGKQLLLYKSCDFLMQTH